MTTKTNFPGGAGESLTQVSEAIVVQFNQPAPVKR
jgi:hypothetical protein